MSTVSKISFGDSPSKNYNVLSERHRKRPLLNCISGMTDSEIIQASVRKANKDVKNTTAARVLNNGPKLFLAATIAGYGALSKGKLSTKLANTAKLIGVTAVAAGLSKPVNAIVDGVLNAGKNDNEPKRTEKHPVISGMLSVAALAATSVLAIKGISKGTNKLAEIFAPTAHELGQKFKKGADVVNKSFAGKISDNFTNKLSEYATKHPKLTKFVKNTGIFIPLAGFMGATSLLSSKIINDRNKLASENIDKLISCRDYANIALNNEAEIDD